MVYIHIRNEGSRINFWQSNVYFCTNRVFCGKTSEMCTCCEDVLYTCILRLHSCKKKNASKKQDNTSIFFHLSHLLLNAFYILNLHLSTAPVLKLCNLRTHMFIRLRPKCHQNGMHSIVVLCADAGYRTMMQNVPFKKIATRGTSWPYSQAQSSSDLLIGTRKHYE